MKFEFDIHVYLHHVAPPGESATALITHLGKNIMTILQTLTAQVAANRVVTDSAVVLLQGLKAKLDEAIANNDLPALQALSDSLATETNDLAAAVAANTPAATPVDVPTEPTV